MPTFGHIRRSPQCFSKQCSFFLLWSKSQGKNKYRIYLLYTTWARILILFLRAQSYRKTLGKLPRKLDYEEPRGRLQLFFDPTQSLLEQDISNWRSNLLFSVFSPFSQGQRGSPGYCWKLLGLDTNINGITAGKRQRSIVVPGISQWSWLNGSLKNMVVSQARSLKPEGTTFLPETACIYPKAGSFQNYGSCGPKKIQNGGRLWIISWNCCI